MALTGWFFFSGEFSISFFSSNVCGSFLDAMDLPFFPCVSLPRTQHDTPLLDVMQ